MKIVHVCKMTGVAGTENHLLALLPRLHQRGHAIHLIVLVEPTSNDSNNGNDSNDGYRAPWREQVDSYCAQLGRLGVTTEQFPIQHNVDFDLIRRLAQRFRELRPDAVHTHLIHADWHGVIAARRANIPKIFWSGHNDDPFRRRPAIRLIQRYLWARVTAGIAISEAVRQFMIKVEGASPQKVHTVHYGFAPTTTDDLAARRAQLRAEWGIAPDAVVFGSVCRLIPQKGLETGLLALQPHLHHAPNTHYVLVGDGPLRDSLTAQADTLGIGPNVHFLGWRADAAAQMAGFDVLLMPSLWEGFGLVALEAMAARLPIIASRVSALPEIVVNGETGYLVPPGEVNLLTVRIKMLLEDAALRQRMGQAGRQRLEAEFTLDKMVEQTLKVYGVG